MPEIPASRRPIERNEYLFVTGRKKRCSPHRMTKLGGAHGDPVTACGVCGKIAKGETLPIGWPVLTP
jgi:hypothetical protein